MNKGRKEGVTADNNINIVSTENAADEAVFTHERATRDTNMICKIMRHVTEDIKKVVDAVNVIADDNRQQQIAFGALKRAEATRRRAAEKCGIVGRLEEKDNHKPTLTSEGTKLLVQLTRSLKTFEKQAERIRVLQWSLRDEIRVPEDHDDNDNEE